MRIKAMVVLSCLSFAIGLAESQNKLPSPKQSTTISMIDWNEKPDVRKWLKENDVILKRGDGCTLYGSHKPDNDYGTGLYSIISFIIAPEDEEMTRLVRHVADGQVAEVRIGIRYEPMHLGFDLQITMAFEGAPENLFLDFNGAQASTFRDQHWKRLSLERHIKTGNVEQSFILNCENGKTFMGFYRKLYKHFPRSKKSQ